VQAFAIKEHSSKVPVNVTQQSLLLAACLCGACAASAQSWAPSDAPSLDWLSVASSADGSKAVAGGSGGQLYTSTNWGVHWKSNSVSAQPWVCMASSADGTKVAAGQLNPAGGSNQIYVSTNAGGTWAAPRNSPEYSSSMGMSADGTTLIAEANKVIYTSADSGATWTSNSISTNKPWGGVASSANGHRLLVAGGHPVFISTDSGTSWSSNYLGTSTVALDQPCAASSADGGTLLVGAGGNGGLIYVSTNFGASWTSNTVRQVWASLACSANGHHMVAVGYPSIYTSTDSGTTWISNNAPRLQWRAAAVSADGNAMLAVAEPGGIYTWQAAPAPALGIIPALSNGNVTVSWVVPSTNLVLQQSPDLAPGNWSDVTNAPTLNLSNLQNQVTAPMLSGAGFYRLRTP
jgi:hypothetical protein